MKGKSCRNNKTIYMLSLFSPVLRCCQFTLIFFFLYLILSMKYNHTKNALSTTRRTINFYASVCWIKGFKIAFYRFELLYGFEGFECKINHAKYWNVHVSDIKFFLFEKIGEILKKISSSKPILKSFWMITKMAISTIKAWWISNNLWCLPLSSLLSCLIQLTWAMIRFRPFNLQTYRSDQKMLWIFLNCLDNQWYSFVGFRPFSKRKSVIS